ncbi:hypothetical protein N7508_006669 [Penicillium antarcticum]|uniref:uncharacterized protein n=1 Tax=Penicillium antarcticum TaxID=416450 RepID=UPI0023868D8C|nr:uncharacterized protein N7508_006669 [Penicillium antarcticum]KAJ5301806.1 hypothetical protein N7508_006669 [Penicillium antarcticum]
MEPEHWASKAAVTEKAESPLIETSMISPTLSLSSRTSGSTVSSSASTGGNYRLVASQDLYKMKGQSRHRKPHVTRHQNSQPRPKEMHVDTSYPVEHEQDNMSAGQAVLRASSNSNEFAVASTAQSVLAMSPGGWDVETESVQSSQGIRENDGNKCRFYADRKDVEKPNSPC